MKHLITRFLLLCLATFLLSPSSLHAADRLVGGDLSMVPAYEQAGDQWLDESGAAIPDLIQYVQKKGWNAVRVRVFVDPSQDRDPSVCQDLAYATALSKRVKEAGMKVLLDLHYSDTWADPGQQRIPASWTDHSDQGLATSLDSYTRQVLTALVEAGAAPDYVQIGNEITYGMLWNTADGKYPTDSKQFAQAGYCPTWSTNFNDGATQWRRLALFLTTATKAVRETVAGAKVVVHTTMPSDQNQTLNFHKHLATAGFTDYDVLALSYYPFWCGKLDNLGAVLSRIKSTYPDKTVQIVETAWYSNGYYPFEKDGSGEYALSSLPSTWTTDAKGLVNYLNDLTTRLKLYDNVDGLYYWQPEECGNGYEKKVMQSWINRGMWQVSNQKRHALLRTSDGQDPVAVLAQYAKDEKPEQHEDASQYFQNLGFETGTLDGWNIEQSFATQKASDITSWASKDVVRGTYSLELWDAAMPGGTIMGQMAQLPNGRYTVSVRARANKTGFYLYAGDAKTLIEGEKADLWAATTNVKKGVLEFGIGAKQSDEDNYAYFDDFTVTRIGDATDEADIDNTQGDDPDQPRDDEYTDEQHIVYRLYPADMTASVKSGKECADSISIPSSILVGEQKFYVNSVEGSAFNKNDRLNYVRVGKSVNTIWGSAFADCWSLHGVEFEEGSQLKTIDGWAFYNTALDSIDVPAGVTEISEGAFSHCWALDKVVLRGEVTKIGKFAFSSWSADDAPTAEPSGSPLSQGVWIYAIEAPQIDPKAFCPEDVQNDTLYVHYTLVENETYKSLGFKDILPLDESDGSLPYTDAQGVKYKLWPEEGTASVVGYDKAHAPEQVKDWQIVIPETVTALVDEDETEFVVTAVEASAFSNHWTLVGVTLPESLTGIGAWAFHNTGLKSIVVYDGVTEIQEGTFSKCWQLANAEFLGDLTAIGDFAFSAWAEEGCASSGNQLNRVVLWSTSVPEISPRAFFADDIQQGSLYVDKALVADAAYTSLGFQQVLPIDPTGIEKMRDGDNEKMRDEDNEKMRNTAGALYDLSGRNLSHSLIFSTSHSQNRGVYIHKGRKLVNAKP